ncbi:hypothetical protein SRABI91_04949 [Rhodococcoides fascians]|nr:hypothetical protein SRABI91_04949 [Rhodococcus fascians]
MHANGYGHLVRNMSIPYSHHAWNVWKTNLFVPKGDEAAVKALLKRSDTFVTE